ncbi:hypothetical protein HY988_03300 [Candidatus Micrarchaeota archaeon]|nr:hypothetical protein [Candidatus Micrarchaeota archaeon]
MGLFKLGKNGVLPSLAKSETALYEFMNAVKKRKLPEKIDWDKEHYEQFD